MRWLTHASSEDLERLLGAGEFFWLDLTAPAAEQVRALVDRAGLDPEAAERAVEFGRPPQLRRYRDHVGLVFYGAKRDQLVEAHVYVSGRWVITFHEEACSSLDQLRDDLGKGPTPAEGSVVGRVLEALAGSFEDLLDPVDERIEQLESQAVAIEERRAPAGGLRSEILERRSKLLRTLRVVRRQRDYVDRAVSELAELPGLEPSQHHELSDVAGQMIRVADAVDGSLDRLAAALDLLNSSLANRMNAIMERLTVVATIFLPLTVVTGFFGQNFGWLVDRIDSLAAFLLLGVALFAVSALGIYAWVRGRLERPAA